MRHNYESVPSAFPLHEWKIIETSFSQDKNFINESVFSQGNGYIGMRGNFEEGYQGLRDTSIEGTYLNGFYESGFLPVGEMTYGSIQRTQTMLNVTDSKIIKLYVEDESFDMLSGQRPLYSRTLDMKEGVLTRELIWISPKGREVKLEIKRVISLKYKHLIAIRYSVTPLNFSGRITLISSLNGEVRNHDYEGVDPRACSPLRERSLELLKKEQEGNFGALIQRTKNSRFTLVCAMENILQTQGGFSLDTNQPMGMVSVRYTIEVEKGQKSTLTKYITYYSSRDYPEEELLRRAKQTLTEARHEEFSGLLQSQKEYLAKFWQQADVEIKGDAPLQQGIRFNIFHLLQSVGRDGKTNIAAKGLSGEGYEGHYFWDTEIYILPFFLYTMPGISRKLLEYRYSILEKARNNARLVSQQKGALFPWRTIAGEECSQYFLAGTAQYHINADIIYAVKNYVDVTQDRKFLLTYGAEMVFETARFWLELGCYSKEKENKFCINGVTGPDEYTAMVNNNFYTNFMAKFNLDYAYQVACTLKKEHLEVFEKLKDKIALEDSEVYAWEKAAQNMYLPYDHDRKIHKQDDSFLDKEVWNFEYAPPEKYPLLLHYHPLVIYRHQVCKQADTLLAFFLLGGDVSIEQKQRDFDYYESLTTHDSSLSYCIHSILASEIGYHEKSYAYFMNTARMDLDNIHNNSQYGLHTAAMAGTWMCVVNGFAGMRSYNGVLNFNPYLPQGWESYKFRLKICGCQLEIEVKRGRVAYRLLHGEEITFFQGQEKIYIVNGEQVELLLEEC